MSNTLLSSEDFGLKIYERFPPAYREVDEHYNLSLKRYLQALGDGGFKYSIEEINGILDLVDPKVVGADVLPLLYSQYGLELFNGIPEGYLRYFLPFLGLSYSKKGSLNVIPFVITSLSGIRASTKIIFDTYGNPELTVTLEMDYQVVGNDFFPRAEQFKRILENFLPFYVTCDIIYLYSLYDEANLEGIEGNLTDKLIFSNVEQHSIIGNIENSTDNIVQNFGDTLSLFDIKNDNQCCWILNDTDSLLNSCTLINLDAVDKITENNTTTVGIPTYSAYILLTVANIVLYNLPLEAWENNGIGSQGNLYNSNTRMRLKDYIPIPGNNYTFTLIIDTEYSDFRYAVQGYNETYDSSTSYEGDWTNNGDTFDLAGFPSDTKYVKISLSLVSVGYISVEQESIKGANYTVTPK